MYRVYTITIYDIRKYTIRVYTTTALIRTFRYPLDDLMDIVDGRQKDIADRRSWI